MEIRFLSVGCGDGIHINFPGSDGKYYNILIDGGTAYGDIYLSTLKTELEDIVGRGEMIDLWIISHIDDDHIGGILRLLKDTILLLKLDLPKTRFWYNYSHWDYDTGIKNNNLKSVRQGMLLRNYLKSKASVIESITDETKSVNIAGANLTILSPDAARLKTEMEKWTKQEIRIVAKTKAQKKGAKRNDYEIKTDDFDLSSFTEDRSEENGSSIAFIFECDKKKFLFLADSHPSVVCNSLSKMGYTKLKKLEVDFMQVAHHGSKNNTTDQLLELIACSDFIISADGINKHNLPHKETLARIIREKQKPVKFYFTHKNRVTESIFKVDNNPESMVLFPESGSNALVFKY